MMERWLSVEAVAIVSTPPKRATWELHPDTAPMISNMAQPRVKLRLFAFKDLNCIAITRTYPVLTGLD
ncbi:hypothetical protein ACHMW9_17955 [Mesorhizobium terrae]